MEETKFTFKEVLDHVVVGILLFFLMICVVYQKKVKPRTLIKVDELTKEKRRHISLDELRACNGLESLSDQEGEAVIESLEKYSHIIYEIFTKTRKRQ